MKRIFLFILIVTVLLPAPRQVSAQDASPVPVEISKDKIRIDGAIYYVHSVKQGQTILMLSKAYDVPISEIEARNPSAKTGLKAGTFVYIPVSSSVSSAPAEKKKIETDGQQAASQERTASGQQSATAKYRRQETETAKYRRQETETAAKQTQPEKNVKKNRQKTDAGQSKYRYRRGQAEETVKAAEAVTEEVEEAVKAKETAAAATSAKAAAVSAAETASSASARTAVRKSGGDIAPKKEQVPAVTTHEVSSDIYDKGSSSHTVTLVLPFGRSASAGMTDLNHTDFYSGVLLALHDLREDSRYLKYRLEVQDLDKWDSPQDMFEGSSIGESDLIIGPIAPQDVEQVAEFAKERKIPMVSPLDIKTSSSADDNPFLFIYPSSSATVLDRILGRFTENADDAAMIVICEKGREGSGTASSAYAALESAGLEYTRYNYAILQNQNVTKDIKALIPEENPVPARIFIASEDEAFTADALRNLNVLVTTEKRNIQVYGMPKWRNFGSVQLEYLHHLNTHISLNYYTDYNSASTLEMTRRYEEVFHTSPTPYAYQGYDITRFFMESMENYGQDFPVKIQESLNQAIQSDIKFMKKEGGGFINTAVRDITYLPDWSVVLE